MKKLLFIMTISTFLFADRNLENYNSKGERDGKSTWYYENGQLEREENYKDGIRDGKWTYYYENGQIEWERNYKDGKPIE